jgi:hypothetical protein
MHQAVFEGSGYALLLEYGVRIILSTRALAFSLCFLLQSAEL